MKKTRLLWIFLLLLALAYIITGMSLISFNIDILKLLPQGSDYIKIFP